MTSHAEKELKLVEEKIEKLKARKYELLKIKSRDEAEEQELMDFDDELKELKAKEKYWQENIRKVDAKGI